jgi:hypothetical protein
MEQNKRLSVISDHLSQTTSLDQIQFVKTSNLFPNGLLFNQVAIITGSGMQYEFFFH